jgi:hypothetical protein
MIQEVQAEKLKRDAARFGKIVRDAHTHGMT